MINKDNYIEFYMDHLDGNLDAAQTAELLDFLEQHPWLKEDLDGIEDMVIKPANDTFNDKLSLKQNPDLPKVNLSNADDYIIEDLELGLTGEDKLGLQNLAQRHPNIQHQINLFKQTFLNANATFTADKSGLYKLSSDAFFYDVCIAYHEGLLSGKERTELEIFCTTHSGAAEILAQFKAVTLTSHALIYPNKKDLKQKDTLVIPLWFKSAMAAAAVVLLGFFLWPNKSITNTKRNYAQRAHQFNTDDYAKINVSGDPALENLFARLAKKPAQQDAPNILIPQYHMPKKQDDIAAVILDSLPADSLPAQMQDTMQILLSPEDLIAHTHIERDTLPAVHNSIEGGGLVAEDSMYDVASNYNLQPKTSPLKPGEFIARSINRQMANDVDETYETDMTYAAINTMGKITGSETNFSKIDNASRSVRSYKLGKLSFYRSTKK